ncbi:acyl carrier protein [Lachnoanaerobaculum gingivalis]|uniref:Acyl carrier protein n=1 Tax=Lachnoanaerobaculum gingivalis TaxID=2490855 RepID=A0A3P3QV43_9FIRM|nr:phosphopantetheine-binding protein [Lachnoanaerobaculum gingivalis]RRJ25051.1 acyl carrier protein [Lachnoanaerobaculum gingivalis]
MENKVMRIIAEISEVNESEIRMELELVDDLEVDSMMSLEILTELEREFDIRISEKDLADFVTVGDIFNFVKEKVDEKK